MKITSSPKRSILINSLRKQLSIMVRNLDEFGIQSDEIHQFLLEVIFSNDKQQNPEDNNQKCTDKLQKQKTVKQNLSAANLVDQIIEEIRSSQITDKALLNCLHNVFEQNSSLTGQSYIAFAPALSPKNETEHKQILFGKKTSSIYKKHHIRQRKDSFQEKLYRRRSQLMERESIFRRRQESYFNDEYYDEDEALEFEGTGMSRIDPMGMMQQEIERLKEMQKKYQQELETKIVEKKKLLDRLNNNPVASQHRPEFSYTYSRNIDY